MMLARGRIRWKRDGLGVRRSSQGEEGVHLMLANPPWHQLREPAEKIPGDKKHDAGLRGFSQRVIRLRCPILHRNAPELVAQPHKREPAWRSWRLRFAGRRCAAQPVTNSCPVGTTVSDAWCEKCAIWDSFAAGFGAPYPNEEGRPDGKTVVLCPLSYVRCRSWGALFAAFRCPALRTARRPEAFRG